MHVHRERLAAPVRADRCSDRAGERRDGIRRVFCSGLAIGLAGKLQLSRGSLGAFITSLGAEDRFELMTFNVAPYRLFNELRSPDEVNTAEATPENIVSLSAEL